MLKAKSVLNSCERYFATFPKFSSILKNDSKTNGKVALVAVSCFFGAPLLIGATYLVAKALVSCRKKPGLNPSEAKTNSVAKAILKVDSNLEDLKRILVITEHPTGNEPQAGLNMLSTCPHAGCASGNQLWANPLEMIENKKFNIREQCAELICSCCQKRVGYHSTDHISLKGTIFLMETRTSDGQYVKGVYKIPADETIQININKIRFMEIHLQKLP